MAYSSRTFNASNSGASVLGLTEVYGEVLPYEVPDAASVRSDVSDTGV